MTLSKILQTLEQLKLLNKLIIGFSMGIIIAIVIGLFSFNHFSKMDQILENVYEKDMLGVYYASDANTSLIYIGRALRSMLIAPDEETCESYQSLIKIRREELKSSLADTRKRLFRDEGIKQYEHVEENLIPAYQYFDRAENLIMRSEEGRLEAAKFITSNAFVEAIKKADDSLQLLAEMKLAAAKASIETAKEESELAAKWLLYTVIFGIGLVIMSGFLISQAIKNPYERLREAVQLLAEGHVDESIPHLNYKNEIGSMAQSINYLKEIYRQSNEQHWLKSQVSEVIEAMQQTDDFRSLTQAVISKVTPMVGAGHGAFYVANSEDEYHLTASYGFRERKHLSNSYGLGEGLVGQCAVEKTMIMLTAPKDYIRINSGLGEGPPACIIVLPVIHSNRVLGVIELASFQQFKEREVALMEGILPSLASNMEILDRNIKTRELLAETREQAERMEMQAAQLEEQTVEMEAQQAELMETENWYKSILETAPDGMLVVDTSGHILVSNPAFCKLFGYSSVELAKRTVIDLFPNDKLIRQLLEDQAKKEIEGSWSTLQGQHKEGSSLEVSIILNTLPSRGTRGVCTSMTVRSI